MAEHLESTPAGDVERPHFDPEFEASQLEGVEGEELVKALGGYTDQELGQLQGHLDGLEADLSAEMENLHAEVDAEVSSRNESVGEAKERKAMMLDYFNRVADGVLSDRAIMNKSREIRKAQVHDYDGGRPDTVLPTDPELLNRIGISKEETRKILLDPRNFFVMSDAWDEASKDKDLPYNILVTAPSEFAQVMVSQLADDPDFLKQIIEIYGEKGVPVTPHHNYVNLPFHAAILLGPGHDDFYKSMLEKEGFASRYDVFNQIEDEEYKLDYVLNLLDSPPVIDVVGSPADKWIIRIYGDIRAAYNLALSYISPNSAVKVVSKLEEVRDGIAKGELPFTIDQDYPIHPKFSELGMQERETLLREKLVKDIDGMIFYLTKIHTEGPNSWGDDRE